jgi:hypothetical protein
VASSDVIYKISHSFGSHSLLLRSLCRYPIMIGKNVFGMGMNTLVLMFLAIGGSFRVQASTSKASKNQKSTFIPVAVQSPGGQANPCEGAGGDFLKLNGLSNGYQRDDGRTLMTCSSAASSSKPQAGAVSSTEVRVHLDLLCLLFCNRLTLFRSHNIYCSPSQDVSCNSAPKMNVSPLTPNTNSPLKSGQCNTNIHWHIGAEHESQGQYSKTGNWEARGPKRREGLLGQKGGRCYLYDSKKNMFTKDYDWKHCDNIIHQVGETIEIHWVNTGLSEQCGTVWQYQFPLLDGVLCNARTVKLGVDATAQDVANSVTVQTQVFTIVNEKYMSRDEVADATFDLPAGVKQVKDRNIWTDVTTYTGSTTGERFGNSTTDTKPCDDVSPVTFQVDRKCHLLTAESLDNLCLSLKRNIGLYDCGYRCDAMAPNAWFSNGESGNPLIPGAAPGTKCCVPNLRADGSRGVNEDVLVANNMVKDKCVA